MSKLTSNKELIQPLFEKLEAHQLKVKALAAESNVPPESISIMGDATLPYAVLKKVLYTCAQAGFRDIALAVEHSTSGMQDDADKATASHQIDNRGENA